ncbi:FG-GAP-like repeat-containing protein [Rhodopirellula bahusiensis]|uniref:FG-GAP-like repeat-containing protein n=2 Tax=Rhodopirellula bahusiensis TaxID=2014065 RepID=UPI0032641A40
MPHRNESVAFVTASIAVLLLLAALGCNKTDVPDKKAANQSLPTAATDDVDVNFEVSKDIHSDAASEPSLQHAQRLLASGNSSEALRELHSLLLKQPDQLDVIALTAQTERSLGNMDSAIALLDESAARLPEHGRTLLSNSAAWSAETGDYQAAITRYQKLLDSEPADVNSLRSIAALQNEIGHRFEANEHLRRLMQLSPMTTVELLCLVNPGQQIHDSQQSRAKPSQKALAIAYENLDENQFQRALETLEDSPTFSDQDPDLLALRVRILTEMGRLDEATSAFADAPEQCRAFPDYWIAEGIWHQANRDLGAAIQAFQKAVELETLHQAALRRLAAALQSNGSDDEASRVSERAQLAKDLSELAASTVNRQGNVGRSCQILSQQLQQIGLSFQSLAWRFNAIAYTTPQQARVDQHLASLRRLKQSLNSPETQLAQRIGLPPAEPSSTDWDSLVASRDMTIEPNRIAEQETSSTQQSIHPHFENIASRVGLNFQYRNASPPVEKNFLLHQPLGSGLACFDYDLDGRTDVYAAQGDGDAIEPGMSSNYLARHLGDSFIDVTTFAEVDDRGYSMALTTGDINQDGFADLVVGNMGRNSLFLNQGDGTFRSISVDNSWEAGRYTTGLAIADVTGDSLPDIIEINYVDDQRIFDPIQFDSNGQPIRLPGPMQFSAAEDRVFVSHPDGSFEGQSIRELAASSTDAHRGMGLVVGDFDADGDNEMFVANDQTQNQLWDRTSSGLHDDADKSLRPNFQDIGTLSGVAYGVTGQPLASMGIAAGDFDGNQTLDFHVTNFDDELSNLYLQQSDHLYSDGVFPTGLDEHSRTMLGFGTQAIDFENDGDWDLVIANGDIEDHRPTKPMFQMPTQLLANQNQRWVSTSPEDSTGYFAREHLARSVARFDWNQDGLMDLLVGDLVEPLALLENQTTTDHRWLQLKLIGTQTERDAIGARVHFHLDNAKLLRTVQTGDGYMSRNENLISVGIPANQSVHRIEIIWPSGTRQSFDNVSMERRALIIESQPRIHWLHFAPPIPNT